jgi:POT family proton-dependent oligopeptide transporter
MLAGLLIYLWGQRYLPAEQKVTGRAWAAKGRMGMQTVLALVAVALSVTVFRGAYEQAGNTVALWADAGVDRALGSWTVPMTWFQSLNPLLVMAMTPILLAGWKKRADGGKGASPAQRMATGALIVAGPSCCCAPSTRSAGARRTGCGWCCSSGSTPSASSLSCRRAWVLFARLAPPGFGATTVAAWYLTIFAGSLTAGLVGTLWSRMSHTAYFALLAGLAVIAAILLSLIDPWARKAEANGSTE